MRTGFDARCCNVAQLELFLGSMGTDRQRRGRSPDVSCRRRFESVISTVQHMYSTGSPKTCNKIFLPDSERIILM